ncbi:hypothetical protein T01_16208 [Trichinella spiralis]|uniref:Uncharacterized protein n=1 Tax=Trichinella spiralis TaxID=6334 RepID=A0A0V1BTP0_TRISP|nr:hypothetical protein T01_16208 [Trichinella spiralis]
MFYLEVKLTGMQNYYYKKFYFLLLKIFTNSNILRYHGTYLTYYYARVMVSVPTSRILVTTKFLNIKQNMSLKYFALFTINGHYKYTLRFKARRNFFFQNSANAVCCINCQSDCKMLWYFSSV